MYVPRVDLYGPVHRGLRWAMARLLAGMGSASPARPVETDAVLRDLDELLVSIEQHIKHEEAFLHPALEARRPGATAGLVHDHAEHANATAGLRVIVGALRSGSTETRAPLWRALYLRFAGFVAENIVHMAEEEEVTQPLLEELFTTDELSDLHDRLLASIPPDEMLAFLRFMLPANDFEFRVGMLAGARAAMPAEAFAGMFAAATVNLAPEEIRELAERLVDAAAE